MTTILAASGIALVVMLAGSVPWAVLSAWNHRAWMQAPWSVAPMALYLWAYLAFLAGRWGGGDGASRRANLQANALPMSVWALALPAGLLGIGAILALLQVVARLVSMPPGQSIEAPPGMPAATMLALVVMQSIVAGVTEEAAFRGYMQSMVGRRLGVVTAVASAGVLFGLLHFPNHPGDVVLMLPYYVAVSAMYGGLTWATGSVLPAMVLHALGDIVVLTRWWLTGMPEWQLGPLAPPLAWDAGIDRPFIEALVVAIGLGLVTSWSYRAIRRQTCQPGVAASVPAIQP